MRDLRSTTQTAKATGKRQILLDLTTQESWELLTQYLSPSEMNSQLHALKRILAYQRLSQASLDLPSLADSGTSKKYLTSLSPLRSSLTDARNMEPEREVQNVKLLLQQLGSIVHNWPDGPHCQTVARMAHDEYTKQLLSRVEILQAQNNKIDKENKKLRAELDELRVDKYILKEEAINAAMAELAEVTHLEWTELNKIVVDLELWIRRQDEVRAREKNANRLALAAAVVMAFEVIALFVIACIPWVTK